MRKLFLSFYFSLLLFPAFSQSPETYTSSEIFQQLKKLNVLGSVLYVGAHPDDENNACCPSLPKKNYTVLLI